MNSLKRIAIAVFALLPLVAAHAESGIGSRAKVSAELPNWTGQWEIDGMVPSPDGGLQESISDVLAVVRQWGPPPYTRQAQSVFDREVARIRTELANQAANPYLKPRCTWGVPMLMIDSPLMFEALVTPEETAMIFSGREIRHIYTDGRSHPPRDDLWPTPWGDSVGHWDGQTLIVDTIAVVNSTWFRTAGNPVIFVMGQDRNGAITGAVVAILSSQAHFVERIRMLDKDHLEDQMVITDPRVFTAPWRLTRRYQRVMGIHRMIHEDCEGGDRNPIVDGRYTLALPSPAEPPLPPPF